MLDILGKRTFFLGEAGCGARMKLVVNMAGGLTLRLFFCEFHKWIGWPYFCLNVTTWWFFVWPVDIYIDTVFFFFFLLFYTWIGRSAFEPGLTKKPLKPRSWASTWWPCAKVCPWDRRPDSAARTFWRRGIKLGRWINGIFVPFSEESTNKPLMFSIWDSYGFIYYDLFTLTCFFFSLFCSKSTQTRGFDDLRSSRKVPSHLQCMASRPAETNLKRSSCCLELPWQGPKMLEGDFAPNFPLKHQQKETHKLTWQVNFWWNGWNQRSKDWIKP